MSGNTQDIGAGVIFIAIGLLFGVGALHLELGTALRMGPGYFPLILAGLLVALGLAIVGIRARPLGPGSAHGSLARALSSSWPRLWSSGSRFAAWGSRPPSRS